MITWLGKLVEQKVYSVSCLDRKLKTPFGWIVLPQRWYLYEFTSVNLRFYRYDAENTVVTTKPFPDLVSITLLQIHIFLHLDL